MRTIHKYQIDFREGLGPILMPAFAKVLSVQFQESTKQLCLWAAIDDEEQAKGPRSVYVLGTGQPAPDYINAMEYIGSAQEGPMVWHVFVEPWMLGAQTKASPFPTPFRPYKFI